MDRKVRERRRSVNRQRGHRRASLVCVIVVLLAAVALFLWLRSSDVFAVRHVTATAVEHVTAAQIADATADARGESLLRLSTADVERRLEALPYVQSVDVHRRFPDTLDILVVECEPSAWVRAGDGAKWLVTADGKVLEKTSATGLPLVVPATAVALEAGAKLPPGIVAALPVAVLVRSGEIAGGFPDVDRIVINEAGEVVVDLQGGTELRLGEPRELKEKLMVAATIIEQYLSDGKQLAYADVSVPDRVAVKAK